MSSLKLKSPLKRAREPSAGASRGVVDKLENLPEVALAAIASSKKQKEVSEFINFILMSLEKNSDWLNDVVGKQTNFRCALMVGAGPNRFQLQEMIYPSDDKDFKLEIELKESEDHDKIAIAALLKLTNAEIYRLLNYIKTRLSENVHLRADLLKGKSMGVNFAILRPFSEKQYRIVERIVVGSSWSALPVKKRHEDKSLSRSPMKKAKRVA